MTRPWLVAYDFSAQADDVTEAAARELQASGGHLILLHVYHVPPPPSTFSALGSEMTYTSSRELGEALFENAKSHLEKISAELKVRFPSLSIDVHVREGDAVDEILECAKQQGAGRIVVGTHGRQGLGYFFLGSVAERVVRLSPISVYVVKTSNIAIP